MIILVIFVTAEFVVIVSDYGRATPLNKIFSIRTYEHRRLRLGFPDRVIRARYRHVINV